MNPGNDRPDLDLYFMRMARLVATRSTCLRRAVGCVLVDVRGHVLSTGYNGVAVGEPHCNEATFVGVIVGAASSYAYRNACAGSDALKGTNLELCRAVHAEQNALLQCRDPYAIARAYVTTAPCDSCLKLFLNTTCHTLIVGEWYARADGTSNKEHVSKTWSGLKAPDGGLRGLIYEERR